MHHFYKKVKKNGMYKKKSQNCNSYLDVIEYVK